MDYFPPLPDIPQPNPYTGANYPATFNKEISTHTQLDAGLQRTVLPTINQPAPSPAGLLEHTSQPSPPQNTVLTDAKVKALAKKYLVSEKTIKKAEKEGTLSDQNLDSIDKALEKYGKEFQDYAQKHGSPSEKLLNKITVKAFLTLKDNQSQFFKLGLFNGSAIVTKDNKGELYISKKIKTLGKGSFGKAKLYESITKAGEQTVIKFARQNVNTREKALKDVNNEFKMLNLIHKDIDNLTGIQDKPTLYINVLSKKGKIIEGGFQGKVYDGDGESIANSFGQPPQLQKGVALNAMQQIFSGLAFLQDNNIAHSDIKTPNLLIRKPKMGETNYTVHIADVGGAKQMKDGSDIAKFTRGSSSPAYTHSEDYEKEKNLKKEWEKNFMSGDIHSSNVKEATFKSSMRTLLFQGDVFSTCATIHHLLTGIYYNEFLQTGAIQNIVLDNYEIMHEGGFQTKALEDAGIPDSIIKMLEQGLDKDYSKRPTAQAFKDALANYKS